MELVICPTCASVTNAAFDETAVGYDGDYENSQLFSGTFRAFAAELAEQLVVGHGLQGRPVVEVGSGKGEFLAMLAQAGAGSATGYDPTYGGEIDHLDPELDIRLVRTMFDSSTVEQVPALVCARHVLEHLPDPVAMLDSVRSALAGDPSCLLYVEVPDADFTFTASGLWDIIYQHCTYFSPVSLGFVAELGGFEVAALRSVFGGQFLALEARPGTSASAPAAAPVAEVERVLEDRARFAREYRATVERWQERLSGWQDAGRTSALWGAGAKGVTFLNLVGSDIDVVVDLNDRKHGRHLPGTGHEVLAPGALAQFRPDVVVVMNAAYEDEIRRDLEDMGVSPEIVLV